jgi:hypothetical protein
MAKLKFNEIYFGIFLRVRTICQNTITWCDKQMDRLIEKDQDLSKYK